MSWLWHIRNKKEAHFQAHFKPVTLLGEVMIQRLEILVTTSRWHVACFGRKVVSLQALWGWVACFTPRSYKNSYQHSCFAFKLLKEFDEVKAL
jgi:hypothetical protein